MVHFSKDVACSMLMGSEFKHRTDINERGLMAGWVVKYSCGEAPTMPGAKPLIHQLIFDPSLTCGHNLWVGVGSNRMGPLQATSG